MRLTIFLLSMFLFSCDNTADVIEPEKTTDQLTELAQNKELWESKSIDIYEITNYYGQLAFPSTPKRLVVVDNKITMVDGAAYNESEYYGPFTILDAFALFESILSENPYSFYITYDPEFGFPTYFSVIYPNPDEGLADDDFFYTFSEFRVIEDVLLN